MYRSFFWLGRVGSGDQNSSLKAAILKRAEVVKCFLKGPESNISGFVAHIVSVTTT